MLNPILYTEKVVSDFLRYQLTTFRLADSGLYEQMRTLLNLEATRATPLMKGPYLSLNRAFRVGAALRQLVDEGLLHRGLLDIAPHPTLWGHQEKAIRHILSGQTTLISSGTGSGKTECFLYPIIHRCLQLRDADATPGIVAVIVYPMNALAEDQLGRLRELLVGTGITFGMYIGKTPEDAANAKGERLSPHASRQTYLAKLEKARQDRAGLAIYPFEERPSRNEMRAHPPRILLTNVKQLELLLTRQKDVELFQNAGLEYLVLDEAHTYKGAIGAETACLIRRLRTFCGKSPEETVCVATSATLVDPEHGPEGARNFASRFFGVARESVALVGEDYEPEMWSATRSLPKTLNGQAPAVLKRALQALGAQKNENGTLLAELLESALGMKIEAERWQESLYEQLAASELLYQIAATLAKPCLLSDLVTELKLRLPQTPIEEEILVWLALAAASRKNERPLLRPVVHNFVRGVAGAVVTLPPGQNTPQLWLSAGEIAGQQGLFPLPILTCTTCGQHYFEHAAADFSFVGSRPEGGQREGSQVVWKALPVALGGKRLLLVDRLVTQDGDDLEAEDDEAPGPLSQIFLCRYCGGLHSNNADACLLCGKAEALVGLFAVQQKEKSKGFLNVCLSCRAIGRWRQGEYREPIKPVRATTVSDIHVLAQNMLHHAERKRLLIFADNRQDAAFQAGWMQDRARRYRLRALMYQKLKASTGMSLGDLVADLDNKLDRDDDLSHALLPEVWREERKSTAGLRHAQERKYFLRIQVLRELTMGLKQRIGLEPWGRMRVDYHGLDVNLPFFSKWSQRLEVTPAELLDGIAALLDISRRNHLLFDRDGRIFTKYWTDEDREIQLGYLPRIAGLPKGLKLSREADDNPTRVQQWLSDRGDTIPRQAARRWGLPGENFAEFFAELWNTLTVATQLLVPVSMVDPRNQALKGTSGVFQIDADKLLMVPCRGTYRCQVCRRVHLRPTPKMVCLAWRCQGTIAFEQENQDDYDLMVLDQEFFMLRPEEHTAQVPPEKREELERKFKGEHVGVNALVCTPTLELGVDIGALDSILMRNIPPLATNYWQRAGRAGRRHRMAVNFTYARTASHDRAYFEEPLKLLQGVITPPRFNMHNELLIEKHVHAAILTALHSLARNKSVLRETERQEIATVLKQVFPAHVKHYLFDANGHVRPASLPASDLQIIITKHHDELAKHAREVFSQGWPEDAAWVISAQALDRHIQQTTRRLEEVIARVWKRLQWALQQMARLDEIRQEKGALDPEEEALRWRCNRLIKKLKGQQSRRRQEAEGYDDTDTYGMLASEGFLPGYGLDRGTVLGAALMPKIATDLVDFDLPRPTAMALREYVPGNLIYANGNRFVPRRYHFEPQDPLRFQVDVANEVVVEIGTPSSETRSIGLGANVLRAVPICDVDLYHQSNISDEEEYRFQLPVTVFGYELGRHNGGKAYVWGKQPVTFRQGVHFRLVNVGAANLVRNGHFLGYPICTVCGHTRSPFIAEAERQNFEKYHVENCGQRPENTAIYADVVADAIALHSCQNRDEAYSVTEALRMGAARILDMEIEDLQILTISEPGTSLVTAVLYDPMPGGSGLLEQVLENCEEVCNAAHDITGNCPAKCQSACIDCLMMFRNAHYHRYLRRELFVRQLAQTGAGLEFTQDIAPQLPKTIEVEDSLSSEQFETLLGRMLSCAGFPVPERNHALDLGRPLGTVTPHFYYEDPSGRFDGICIFITGFGAAFTASNKHHVNQNQIVHLRNTGYEVFEVPCRDLFDREKVKSTFYRLGRILLTKDQANALRDDPAWFEKAMQPEQDHTSLAGWEETLSFLDSRFHGLAKTLERHGIPAPDDVHWGIPVNGIVSEHEAIMMWRGPESIVVLTEGKETTELNECQIIWVNSEVTEEAVVSQLKKHLERTNAIHHR